MITTLRLSHFHDSQENLRCLLLLPAKPEELSFTSFPPRTPPRLGWDLASLAKALSPHKSTLRSLCISLLNKRWSLADFNLRNFTNLENLSLSY